MDPHTVHEIWDSYLTLRDREDCARNPAHDKGLGRNPALLMIDNYRRAFKYEVQGREGGRRKENLLAVAAHACLPSLVKLLATARSTELPVVHLTKQTSAAFGIRDWNEPPGQPPTSSDDFDFVHDLRPLPGEAVIMKTAPSGFMHTPLLTHLMSMGIDTVIVAGESTSGCVRASVVDARAYGFTVGVVTDCTFDRHEATHALNLFDMHRKYARLLTLEEALQYFEKTQAATRTE